MKLNSQLPISIFLLLWVPAAYGSPINFQLSERNAKNQLKFESQTPTEYIEGRATKLGGMVILDPARPTLDLKGTVHLTVNNMETGIDMRDQHMRSSDWLDSDRYPVIRFDLGVLTPKDVIQKGKGKWFVQAKGDIVIKGIPKSISVPVDIRLDESSALKKVIIEGRFKIRLEDHGIRGPAAMRMIGVRVSPDVNVSFKLVGLAEKNWEK